jgi:hypothetical protein
MHRSALARSLKASGFRPTRTPQAMVTSLVGMLFTLAYALALKGGVSRRHGSIWREVAGSRCRSLSEMMLSSMLGARIRSDR